MAVLLGLVRFRANLKPTAVDRNHRHFRRGTIRVRNGILRYQWKFIMCGGVRVALIDPLLANLMNQPFDRLGPDLQVGELVEIAGCLLI